MIRKTGFAGAIAATTLGLGCATAGAAARPVPPDTTASTSARVPASPTLNRVLDSILAAPQFRAAMIGVLVVDAASGDTLYARNAHTALMPASNMKIVTGSVALTRLGADYRYRTTFALRGSVRDSVLTGDVLVFGRGDPTVSQRMRGNPLLALSVIADSLRRRGVRRVSGRLVHAGDAFPGSIHGPGWAHDYLEESYAAGVDELTFNEGLAFVPGHPSGGDTLWTPAARAPATAYLEALRAALATRGIDITGPLARDSLATIRPADITFTLYSPPLSEILGALEKPSQNQMAEALFRTLALELRGAGMPDTARRIVSDQLREWGADTLEFNIADGSGLSRYNLLSPATVVRVLLTMRGRPEFAVFHSALAAVGSEGTVRRWLRDTRAAQVVRGKTGTLFSVRAFSGYATSLDGRPIVFSFISNHHLTGSDPVTTAIQAMLRALTELPLAR